MALIVVEEKEANWTAFAFGIYLFRTGVLELFSECVLQYIIRHSIISSTILTTGVKKLSVTELNDLLEEIETAIKDYSEELVQQLAFRDELEFEKEVKNSFISLLIEVQNKQREQKEMAKKKKRLKNGSPQNGKQERSHMPGTVRILFSYVCLNSNALELSFNSR